MTVPARSAQLLLAHVLGRSREWVIAHPEAAPSAEQSERYTGLLRQAEQGVPLPYLLGHWEFYGLDFVVTPVVLIPRPETETLVDLALRRPPAQAIDVGAGSGIIAVTLAVHLPGTRVTAIDISAAALAVARANAEQHGVADRITFVESDLLAGPADRLGAPADLICANLPYIPSADLAGLEVARREPALALDGGPDGLSLIRRLLAEAGPCLAPRGRLLLEIEYRQGPAARAAAEAAFPGAWVRVHPDLAGLDRVLEIELNV